MRLVITGALGHIGSRLIHDIRVGDFEEVCLVDNLSTQRYSALFQLPEGVRYQFLEKDILTADLDGIVNGAGAVVHLAALTDAANSHGRRDEVMAVNLEGTRRVAEACVKNQVRLIFPSTTSVYGTQAGLVDETCLELKPQSPYAESKLAAEQELIRMHGEGLDVVICRLGTIFGPSVGMRFHTAVNKFTWQAVLGQQLTVWRMALNQKRPYLDLTDAVRLIRFLLGTKQLLHPLYNVVTVNTTVQGILDLLQTFVGKTQIELTDSPIMNQLSYEVSAERIKAEGFSFAGDLARGISDTIALLKSLQRC